VTAELRAPLDAPSLVELAVRRLRAEIVSGAFAPGERLVEEQLTRRLGISRAPLREALRLLGQQGLVEHLPRRGVRVVALSARDIDELFSLRDVLERFALECVLGRGGVPELDRLAVAEPRSSGWRPSPETPPSRLPRIGRSTCRWSRWPAISI
jgi:DNA-binding GntR family transcriptional regulator